jgi:hypothetical protein
MKDLLPNTGHDIMIVNTLDGRLHGIQKSTGSLLWSKQLNGPNVVVQDKSPKVINNGESKLVFIPEPGSGDLYYIEPGKQIQQFDKSLKELVTEERGVRSDKHIFTGHKTTTVFEMDPLTGKVLKLFGSQGQVQCSESNKQAVFLSRTEYTLHIWDRQKAELFWNITMIEYGAVIDSTRSFKQEIVADVTGKFGIKNPQDKLVSMTEFGSAVVAAFDVDIDESGSHLIKYSDSSQDYINKKGYVGNVQGTLFLLSDRTYPHLAKIDAGVDPAALECHPSSPEYPNCLVGTYDFQPESNLLEGVTNEFEWRHVFHVVVIFFLFVGSVGIAMEIVRLFRRHVLGLATVEYRPIATLNTANDGKPVSEDKPESTGHDSTSGSLATLGTNKDSVQDLIEKGENENENPSSTMSKLSTTSRSSFAGTGLRAISVSDVVLGYGSHGTVVLQGTFQGRRVAVKRMLADFYNVADHEVKMLQESDLHPNVVRYFFKVSIYSFKGAL